MTPNDPVRPDGPLPDDAAIVAAIAPLIVREGIDAAAVRLASRRPNACFSSSPTEIVVLALPDGTTRELFVKYSRSVVDPEPRCRRDVTYCSLVYDRILHHLPIATVRSRGLVAVGSPPVAALVLDHLDGALRVNEAPDDTGLLAAAAWCGQLHNWGRTASADPALGFLSRYDIGYYRAWSTRARRLSAVVGTIPAWLERACAEFDDRAVALVAAEQTIIHGEFGPQNVLWRDGVVHPVDWESAAVGPGAIDLAALLCDWPADTVQLTTDAYWSARGTATPSEFADAFAAATLYTALRWLPDPATGDRRFWEAGLARLERAASLGTKPV